MAAGHDAAALQVVGTLRTVKDGDGRPDLAGTMDGVPALVAAGVTDVRTTFPIPDDPGAAADALTALVEAFRRVTAP